jgi:molybdate/tungstate transport system substrate-binding protein
VHLKDIPDVLILSDEALVDMFLSEAISWYVRFAYDSIVLAFTDKSPHASLISKDNWAGVIEGKDVRLARMDEKISALGYRTLIFLELAEKYYHRDFSGVRNNFLPANIFSSEKELHFLLLANDLDYIFDYLSNARRYKLNYISFPSEINLSDDSFRANYAKSKVIVSKQEFNGAPIRYIVTIPNDAKHHKGGQKFLETFFSKDGMAILKKYNFSLMQPFLVDIGNTNNEVEWMNKVLEEELSQ